MTQQPESDRICIGHGHKIWFKIFAIIFGLALTSAFVATIYMNMVQHPNIADRHVIYINEHGFAFLDIIVVLGFAWASPYVLYLLSLVIISRKHLLVLGELGDIFYNNIFGGVSPSHT